jgi:hypothetical protein
MSGHSIDIAESLPTIALTLTGQRLRVALIMVAFRTLLALERHPQRSRRDDLRTIARDRDHASVNREPPLRKTRVRIRRFSR